MALTITILLKTSKYLLLSLSLLNIDTLFASERFNALCFNSNIEPAYLKITVCYKIIIIKKSSYIQFRKNT